MEMRVSGISGRNGSKAHTNSFSNEWHTDWLNWDGTRLTEH